MNKVGERALDGPARRPIVVRLSACTQPLCEEASSLFGVAAISRFCRFVNWLSRLARFRFLVCRVWLFLDVGVSIWDVFLVWLCRFEIIDGVVSSIFFNIWSELYLVFYLIGCVYVIKLEFDLCFLWKCRVYEVYCVDCLNFIFECFSYSSCRMV